MTKMFVVTRKTLVILILIVLMAPMALASDYINTFCFDANTTQFDGRFELSASEIVEGTYQLTGSLTDQITGEVSFVDGGVLLVDGVLKMTLRTADAHTF